MFFIGNDQEMLKRFYCIYAGKSYIFTMCIFTMIAEFISKEVKSI